MFLILGSERILASSHIIDTQAPIIKTKNFTVLLDRQGQASITVDAINAGTMDVSAFQMSINQTIFNASHVGENWVQLTAVDIFGNSSTNYAKVTVKDDIAPLVLTKNQTVYLNEEGFAIIKTENINNGSSDAAGICQMSVYPDTLFANNIGFNAIELKVTDVNGNTSKSYAYVQLIDPFKPKLKTKDFKIEANSIKEINLQALNFVDSLSDHSGIKSIQIYPNYFSKQQIGKHEISVIVEDSSGNYTVEKANFYIEDQIAPILITKDLMVQLNDRDSITIQGADFNLASIDIGKLTYHLNKSVFDKNDVGINNLCLEVIDETGNISSTSAKITILPQFDKNQNSQLIH